MRNIMDLIFLKLSLEKYKTSKNIFKNIYFYIRIWLIRNTILLKIIEKYDYYDMIVQYIELTERIKSINSNIELSNNCNISVKLSGNYRNLTMTFKDDIYILDTNIDGNRIISVNYINTINDTTNVYHFDINDTHTSENNDTIINAIRTTTKLVTRLQIVKSIDKIIKEL